MKDNVGPFITLPNVYGHAGARISVGNVDRMYWHNQWFELVCWYMQRPYTHIYLGVYYKSRGVSLPSIYSWFSNPYLCWTRVVLRIHRGACFFVFLCCRGTENIRRFPVLAHAGLPIPVCPRVFLRIRNYQHTLRVFNSMSLYSQSYQFDRSLLACLYKLTQLHWTSQTCPIQLLGGPCSATLA